MSKKITINSPKSRPETTSESGVVDQWITSLADEPKRTGADVGDNDQQSRGEGALKPKPPAPPPVKLTVEISRELHRRTKLRCVREGITITEGVRQALESRFPSD